MSLSSALHSFWDKNNFCLATRDQVLLGWGRYVMLIQRLYASDIYE